MGKFLTLKQVPRRKSFTADGSNVKARFKCPKGRKKRAMPSSHAKEVTNLKKVNE